MSIIKSIFFLIKGWTIILFQFIVAFFMSSTKKNREILALRSQLAFYEEQVINKTKAHSCISTTMGFAI